MRRYSRFGGDAEAVAHDRLDQHAGDAVCVAPEHVFELIGIVGLHEVRKALQADGNALAVGQHGRVAHLGPFVHGREPHRRVEQSVIAALQNHVVVSPGVCPRQPQSRHHRLGAGVGKTHELGRRHHLGDAFGHVQFTLGGKREHPADLHARMRRRIDPGIRISENCRPVAQPVIDVGIVVQIHDARTTAALDINGPVLAPVTEIGGDAQRQMLHGTLEMCVVLGQCAGHRDSPHCRIICKSTLTSVKRGVHGYYILV